MIIPMNEIHSFLDKEELAQISEFTIQLAYKNVNRILPQIYKWVQTGAIDKKQFALLITYYFGDLL